MGDESKRRAGFQTYRGFAAPGIDEPPRPEDMRSVDDAPESGPAPGPYDERSLVEIEVVHQVGPAPKADPPFPTVEVWTQNRIYTTDPFMRCIEVRDRSSRKAVTDHPFLGSRLVGGQHHESGRVELSYPYPRPGTEAVFEAAPGQAGAFARTSTVERVVLRLHVVTVAPSTIVPTWSEISNSILPPPPRGEG